MLGKNVKKNEKKRFTGAVGQIEGAGLGAGQLES